MTSLKMRMMPGNGKMNFGVQPYFELTRKVIIYINQLSSERKKKWPHRRLAGALTLLGPK
jgi:hypothetical protein